MTNTNIGLFINRLKQLSGKEVCIQIKHELFGSQKILCIFRLIDNDEYLGFSVNGEAKYILKAKLLEYGYKDNIYFMADDLMRIEVKTA